MPLIDPNDPEELGGRYRLEREIGRGGSATVYLAHDQERGERVVVKLLREELAHSVGTERFAREIRVMMRLRHPHILPILDSGSYRDRPYYVMPYVEGETLRDRLQRERQLPVEDVRRLGAALCSALGFAHRANVLHRDVKPANVWIAGTETYLTDFGLALEGEALSGDRITSSGVVAGTSAYMSPEQVSGERRLDHRTDIYSLGCVLYEALAGVRPFQGATEPAIRAMRLTSDPPPLRALRPGVPAQMEAALARAMAREPADRWEDAAAFEQALVAPDVAARATHRATTARVLPLAAAIAVVIVAVLLWKRALDGRASSSEIGVSVTPRSAAGTGDGSALLASRAARSVADVFAQIAKLDVRLDDHVASGSPPRARSRAPVAYAVMVEVRAPAGTRELWLTLRPERARDAATRYSARVAAESDVDSLAASLAIAALRTIAIRDSATLMDTRAAVLATTVPGALARLLEAQRQFGQSDGAGAVRALKRALLADSTCTLASVRLSMVYSWLHHYDSAASVIEALVRQRPSTDVVGRLLRGAHAFATGNGDSALANFQLSVVDDPSNVDGWFGLAESLMHLGWRVGHDAQDAYSAFEAVARIDSGFAPIYYHAFDLALARRDLRRARTFLARIPSADPTFPSRRIALTLATSQGPVRDSVLRSLTGEVRRTLSELVLFYSRHAKSPQLADTIARALADPSRTPDDRLRGLRYRLVLAPSLGRTMQALQELRSEQVDQGMEDAWVAAVVLAGLIDPRFIEPQLDLARARLRVARPGEPLASPLDPLWQSGELLVACVLVALPSCDGVAIRADMARLDMQRGSAHRVVRRWLASLDAKRALSRGDTARALTLLAIGQEGLRDTYVSFFPLASYPAHRRVETEILCRMGSRNAAIPGLSFERSESLADVAFTEAPFRKCLASRALS